MLNYLAIPNKPALFADVNQRLRWLNFQFGWPSESGKEGACSGGDVDYKHPFIAETNEAYAWGAFVNTMAHLAILNGAAIPVQLFFRKRGWRNPRTLTFPRCQIFLLQLSMSGASQGCGFVLAHSADWLKPLVALATFSLMVAIALVVASHLQKGLVKNELFVMAKVDGKLAWTRCTGLDKWWAAQEFREAYEELFCHLSDLSGRQPWEKNVAAAIIPLRFVKTMLVGLQLGVWVCFVPHCNSGAQESYAALQLSGLLLVTGGDVGMLVWLKPFKGTFRTFIIMTSAVCDFLTMVVAVALWQGFRYGYIFMVSLQMVSATASLIWFYYTWYLKIQRWRASLQRMLPMKNITFISAMTDYFTTFDPYALGDVPDEGLPPKEQEKERVRYETITEKRVMQNPLYAVTHPPRPPVSDGPRIAFKSFTLPNTEWGRQESACGTSHSVFFMRPSIASLEEIELQQCGGVNETPPRHTFNPLVVRENPRSTRRQAGEG